MYAIKINGNGRCQSLVEDIFQSIKIILLTRKGEKIHDPDFGCGVWDELDRPHTRAPYIVKEVYKALRKYEPRIEVLSVVPKMLDVGRLEVEIEFIIKDTNQKTSITIGGF